MKFAIWPLLTLLSVPALGQQSVIIPPQEPTLIVAARGEVKVQPDRANVQIAVETRAPTAAAAAAENARLQQRVIAAIRAAGVPNDQIRTTQYTVFPDYRHDPNREPQLVGYRVSNTVDVELRQIDQVGPVLDAALGAGANRVAGLRFYSSNAETARREAIGVAMANARLDAEALARAAGGALGGLLEAQVGAFYAPPPPVPFMERVMATAAAADTPIQPGEQTISVEVSTRWRFVGAR